MAKAPLSQTVFLTEDGTTIQVTVGNAVDVPPLVVSPTNPAPSFIVRPSIEGSPVVGQALRGNDGTILNGTPVSRRWFLNGALASTGSIYTITTAGALVYEVTAHGPGGSTTETSEAVTITKAGGELKPLRAVGMNLSPINYYVASHPLTDRMKTSSAFYTDFNVNGTANQPPINSDGYPTGYASGQSNAAVNISHDGAEALYEQNYVVESNKTDFVFAAYGATIISQKVADGKRRMIVSTAGQQVNGENWWKLDIRDLASPFVAGVDYITCVRLDEEDAFKAGTIFNKDFVAQMRRFGTLRPMDWVTTNSSLIQRWSERPLLSWSSWERGVPLEAMVQLANLTDTDLHLTVPFLADDDYLLRTGQYVEANLKSSLRAEYENANEVWNSGQGFYETWRQAHDAYSPAKGNTSDPNWGNQGYSSALKMAKLRKAHGYSSRVRCLMMGQAGYSAVLAGNVQGAEAAISEWSTPGSSIYNVEFAERFAVVNQLYDYFGEGSYFDGNLCSGIDAASKTKIEGWSDATDDSGLAAAFRQLEFGDQLSGNAYTLSHYADIYQPLKQLAAKHGVGLLSYEGGLDMNVKQLWADGDPYQQKVYNLYKRLRADARMGIIYTKWLTLLRSIVGFSVINHFYEFGPYRIGTSFGVQPSLYSADTPRWKAMSDFNANPSSMAALTATVETAGDMSVGGSAITTIRIAGGLGKPKISVTGLADGRALVGTRITGTFLTEQSRLGQITITDEAGELVTLDYQQTVGPKKVGFRFFRFTPGKVNYGGSPGDEYYGPRTRGFIPKQGGAAVSTAGWTASTTMQTGGDRDVAWLVDNDDATEWAATFRSAGYILFDAGPGNAAKPDGFDIGDSRSDSNFTFAQMTKIEVSNDGNIWQTVAQNVTLAYMNGYASVPLNYLA